MEPILEQYRPIVLSSLTFSKLTLGTVAPQFTGYINWFLFFYSVFMFQLFVVVSNLLLRDNHENDDFMMWYLTNRPPFLQIAQNDYQFCYVWVANLGN